MNCHSITMYKSVFEADMKKHEAEMSLKCFVG